MSVNGVGGSTSSSSNHSSSTHSSSTHSSHAHSSHAHSAHAHSAHHQTNKTTHKTHAHHQHQHARHHDSFRAHKASLSKTAGPTTPAKQRLADAARQTALNMGGYHSTKKCATGVSRAIASALHISVSGDGNTIGDHLPADKFHEVNMSLADALKTPGNVLTWDHTSTAAGAIYGHAAITLGDGTSSASDFVESNTLAASTGRTGLRVFSPNM